MRIARLAEENPRTQGPERRAWYRRNSPAHLRAVATLVEDALTARTSGGPSRAVVLGAGACTEAPLERIARTFESVLLVDVDVPGMAHARDELPASLRSRVDLLQADITGGVSDALASDLRAQPWRDLARLGPSAPLEAAAACLERCPVADPPQLPTLAPQGYSLVFSDLVLTQLYSLPLLDVVDMLAMYAPDTVDLRETHHALSAGGAGVPAAGRAGASRAAGESARAGGSRDPRHRPHWLSAAAQERPPRPRST